MSKPTPRRPPEDHLLCGEWVLVSILELSSSHIIALLLAEEDGCVRDNKLLLILLEVFQKICFWLAR